MGAESASLFDVWEYACSKGEDGLDITCDELLLPAMHSGVHLALFSQISLSYVLVLFLCHPSRRQQTFS